MTDSGFRNKVLDFWFRIPEHLHITAALGGAGHEGGHPLGAFVQVDDNRWSNLSRASGISIKEDLKAPGQWVVIAHFSGAHPVIRDGFATSTEARAWVADLLERAS